MQQKNNISNKKSQKGECNMFELTGKYESCKVFTDNTDNETISQLMNLLNQEFIKGNKIRIMPDTHAGAGCVIGTTMTINDKIVPNLVGVDIGCGMHAVKLKESKIDFNKLDEIIKTYVPSGFAIWEHPVSTNPELTDIYAPINIDRANKSLGTLGGGNHFIEIDRDSDNNLWLVVHTGSRHLGIEICSHYQNLAYESLKDQIPNIPKELAYVHGNDFDNYIHDMKITQRHAILNRKTIVNNIINHMDWNIATEFETIHNYIDCENMILRKGSVSAQLGEALIIPINMHDGSLICMGKGNPDWNYSAPHGAGRLMSRSEAKENISIEEYQECMKGIYTTSVCPSTLDESPMAYKPMQEIIDNIQDTVEVIDIIKPVYNYKNH